MTARKQSTRVPYSAAEMFALVADIERYPEFLPWCVALRVAERRREDCLEHIVADMAVAYKVFRERFRSLVRLDHASRTIDVEYLDGPFRTLANAWRFLDEPGGGSIVEFSIEFEFRNRLLQATAHSVFEKAFVKMSDAFVERAYKVYGNSSYPA
ncbi:MAG: type II toxin-antitoxin system RatA family toxin [Parvularculaceae bacterium]|nr:type II toxin-antitoxin system RatA family toxin [Parvularculaceae bacterium]